jgi:hypothetical protein
LKCSNCNVFRHTTAICATNNIDNLKVMAEGRRNVGAVNSKSTDNKQNQFQWQVVGKRNQFQYKTNQCLRESVLSGRDPLFLLELNHQRLKLMSLLMPKVHLKLNLNVPVMLNVSGVRGMDILLQTVQTREL